MAGLDVVERGRVPGATARGRLVAAWLERVQVRDALRVGSTCDSVATAAAAASRLESPRCTRNSSATCSPTSSVGERGLRVLEDHRDLVAANAPQRLAPQPRQRSAVVDDLAGHLGVLREQLQDAERDRGLAAARLADQRQHLAPVHLQAYVTHGRDRRPLHAVGGAQPGHAQDRSGVLRSAATASGATVRRTVAAGGRRRPAPRAVGRGCRAALAAVAREELGEGGCRQTRLRVEPLQSSRYQLRIAASTRP